MTNIMKCRLSKASSMKTIHSCRYDKENLLFSFFPINMILTAPVTDLNIKYLKHLHTFWPRKESVLLNIKLGILISRCCIFLKFYFWFKEHAGREFCLMGERSLGEFWIEHLI